MSRGLIWTSYPIWNHTNII